jgi:hypothetical protein
VKILAYLCPIKLNNLKQTIMKNYNKKVAVYDNQGRTYDRITIVFLDTKTKSLFGGKFFDYDCVGASETGEGFYLYSTCQRGKHLGKKIKLESLHPDLLKKVLCELK